MRTLIAYATRSGASRECAEILASGIVNCVLCDLNEATPDIAEYDTVVIGSGIRMGKTYPPFKKFIEDNEDILLTKNIAFFVCNVQTGKYMKFVENGIPERLRNAAFRISAFGGKPPLGGKKKHNWMLRDEIIAFTKAVKEKT
jgi:menaquinone-dependent protoporphyrinogen oxidase